MKIPERDTPEWYAAWGGLQAGLKREGIETTVQHGSIRKGFTTSKRPAITNDFMLMHVDAQGVTGFKHHDTRNYVYLYPSGYLYVPKTFEAFNRGEF